MAFMIAGFSFVVFTGLLIFGLIGEAAYCFLVASSLMLGLVLHGFGRLQELDLKNLRLVLREIEQTKKELFVKEHQLRAIALPLVQLLAFSGSSAGRWGSTEGWIAMRDWHRAKVAVVIDAIGVEGVERSEVQKYMDKYAEIDSVMSGGPLTTENPEYPKIKATLELLQSQLIEMLHSDIAAAKATR